MSQVRQARLDCVDRPGFRHDRAVARPLHQPRRQQRCQGCVRRCARAERRGSSGAHHNGRAAWAEGGRRGLGARPDGDGTVPCHAPANTYVYNACLYVCVHSMSIHFYITGTSLSPATLHPTRRSRRTAGSAQVTH